MSVLSYKAKDERSFFMFKPEQVAAATRRSGQKPLPSYVWHQIFKSAKTGSSRIYMEDGRLSCHIDPTLHAVANKTMSRPERKLASALEFAQWALTHFSQIAFQQYHKIDFDQFKGRGGVACKMILMAILEEAVTQSTRRPLITQRDLAIRCNGQLTHVAVSGATRRLCEAGLLKIHKRFTKRGTTLTTAYEVLTEVDETDDPDFNPISAAIEIQNDRLTFCPVPNMKRINELIAEQEEYRERGFSFKLKHAAAVAKNKALLLAKRAVVLRLTKLVIAVPESTETKLAVPESLELWLLEELLLDWNCDNNQGSDPPSKSQKIKNR
jgi:hypothetical protein